MIYWMVFTEKIQVRGILAIVQSSRSLLIITVGEIHLQSIFCFWTNLLSYSGQPQLQSKEATLLWERMDVSESLRQASLRKITCLHLYSPCGLGRATQHGTWNWRVFLSSDRELVLEFFGKKEWAMQARAQEPGFEGKTHWENALHLQMKLVPARRSSAVV